MKNSIFNFLALFLFSLTGFSQASDYNLKSENLHKKVKKTVTNYYYFHQKSDGFVKLSVSTNTYNEEGNLIETYYDYTNSYDGSNSTTSTLYNYNSNNQLISTQDLSAKKSKYSSFYRFFYDSNGNLTKREAHFNDGAISYTAFAYDSKNRKITSENYSSKGVLTGRTSYSYNGNNRKEINQNFNEKDGSLYGTYTTNYKDDVKISYEADSKYGKTNTGYQYDKNDNIIATIDKDKPASNTRYDYDYDSKGNWTKKHYQSGNNHYFYFREVHFKNGDTSGSVTFDPSFVNRYGNFKNSSVVPLVPTKTTTTSTTTTVNTTMPVFTSKKWIFNFVNLDDKISSLQGEVKLQVLDNTKMDTNSKVKISYSFGGKEFVDTYTVNSFIDMKEYGFWTLSSATKSTTLTVSIYNEKKYIESRELYLSGMVSVNYNNKKTAFYLE